jgi:tetrahydromethanopterin S-methyltransferase subunit E
MTDLSGVQPATPTPSADKRGDIIAFGVLALVALVIVLVFLVVIMGVKVDPVELTLLTLVVGAPITALGVITGFQFGSSKGSQVKDAQIAALTPPITPAS